MLFEIKHDSIPESNIELENLVALWQREMGLLNSALYINARDCEKPEKITRLIERIDGGVTFIAVNENISELQQPIKYRINKPDAIEQKWLWQICLGESALYVSQVLDSVATQFRFSTAQIRETSSPLIEHLELADNPGKYFWQHCRNLDQARIGNLGQFVEVKATWDDLVLPDQNIFSLQQILTHVQQKLRVYHDWGFAEKSHRGLGISVLFCGESGTGKTMAAEVLANELNLDLYRIDLSSE